MVEEEKDNQQIFERRKNIFADTVSNKSRASSKGHSRTVRRKLYFLFGMLVMVLLLMKEASKPENWQWLGFEANQPREGAIFLEDVGSLSPSVHLARHGRIAATVRPARFGAAARKFPQRETRHHRHRYFG